MAYPQEAAAELARPTFFKENDVGFFAGNLEVGLSLLKSAAEERSVPEIDLNKVCSQIYVPNFS